MSDWDTSSSASRRPPCPEATDDEPEPYYEFPRPIPLKKTVEDLLEDNVPEKYYMKQEVTDKYIQTMSVEYSKDESVEQPEEELW